MRRTKQAKALSRFSQLYLSAKEWMPPEPVYDDGPFSGHTGEVVAWIVRSRSARRTDTADSTPEGMGPF